MKKVLLLLVVAVFGFATANAQFEKGGKTISALLNNGQASGLLLEFGDDYTNFGVGAKASYFVMDNLPINASVGVGYNKVGDRNTNNFLVGVGASYYFYKMFYAGAGVDMTKVKDIDVDFAFKVDVGATYYLTQNVFVNPAVFCKFGDTTRFGLELGIGVNF